jgi:Holliday junction resolvase RusA-like endonuclease
MKKFEVPGDPVPYLRMTQKEVRMSKAAEASLKGGQITKYRAIHRYWEYKNKVQLCSLQVKFDRNPQEKMYIHIDIYFRNKKHGDPDNIIKCVLDAIFDNDKYVAPCCDFFYDKDNPRVEVSIL